MAICKHCGAEIEEGLEYCPNCGQNIEEFGDFFEPVEELEEEAYNIFDAPEDFDMDELLSKEFAYESSERNSINREETEELPELDMFAEADAFPELEALVNEEAFPEFEPYTEPEMIPESDSFAGVEELGGMDLFEDVPAEESAQTTPVESEGLADLFGLFDDSSEESAIEELPVESKEGLDFPMAEGSEFIALDDLFQDMDAEPEALSPEEPEVIDQGLEELLAAGTEEVSEVKTKSKKKKSKKEKQSFFKRIFGNVPIDPSKIKPEPTPEQIAAKKQKEEEEKKAKAEEKKLAAEEKKQIAQREKDEKARQKALAKEEKKAKKLQEAKLILEEMKDTRINRVGATIVFVLFAVCAFGLLFGSDIFGYSVSIHNATDHFNKAYNNDVKYYNDAYNDIYGLKIKPEDQVLNDKIMTVMFVNKELNSYNSHIVMKDYHSALHSLLLGLYRYGKYYEQAVPLGIDRDMDYVRTQILKELDSKFGISEDEAEVLRSMLEAAGAGGMHTGINADAAREYNLELYEIVKESGLEDDSNN